MAKSWDSAIARTFARRIVEAMREGMRSANTTDPYRIDKHDFADNVLELIETTYGTDCDPDSID